jgi:hypothetical protein
MVISFKDSDYKKFEGVDAAVLIRWISTFRVVCISASIVSCVFCDVQNWDSLFISHLNNIAIPHIVRPLERFNDWRTKIQTLKFYTWVLGNAWQYLEIVRSASSSCESRISLVPRNQTHSSSLEELTNRCNQLKPHCESFANELISPKQARSELKGFFDCIIPSRRWLQSLCIVPSRKQNKYWVS